MVIQTERLILREYVPEDWGQVHIYASDADLVKYMDWGPNTEDDTRAFVEAMIKTQEQNPRAVYEFAVTLKTNGMLIGGSGLAIPQYGQAALGYCLNKQYWGRGFATEAASALCGLGFRGLDLHRIFAACRPDNVASARVMEKIGMKREGMLREHMYAKGKWQNSFVYSILADEFLGMNGR